MMDRSSSGIRAAKHSAFLLTKEFAITTPSEIIIEDIAMAIGVLIVEEPLAGAEARLIRKGNSGIVRISSSIDNIARKRFAIAHELGHWRLHQDVIRSCTDVDMLGPGSTAIEAEANAFAGSFLMPTSIFSPYCNRIAPDFATISKLAEVFQTSVTATAIRFVDECLQPCMVVASEGNKIKWWTANSITRLWVDRDLEIDQRSSAIDASCNNRHRINSSVWFPDNRGMKNIAVYEQSIMLGRFGTVLTLVSVLDNVDALEAE
jgi:Zn-dependent peptidase ImmA (M78 family)